MDPQKLRYAKTHEWASLEGDVCTVGLTQFAVDQLTDVIYIELPDVGEPIIAGDSFGEIESVKSVNDLYCPVDGEVTPVNAEAGSRPDAGVEGPLRQGLAGQGQAGQGRHARSPDDSGAISEADRGGRTLRDPDGGAMNILLTPPASVGTHDGPAFGAGLRSWEQYEKFLEAVGERRIRLTYDRGTLELMTISRSTSCTRACSTASYSC